MSVALIVAFGLIVCVACAAMFTADDLRRKANAALVAQLAALLLVCLTLRGAHTSAVAAIAALVFANFILAMAVLVRLAEGRDTFSDSRAAAADIAEDQASGL